MPSNYYAGRDIYMYYVFSQRRGLDTILICIIIIDIHWFTFIYYNMRVQ